MKEIKITFFKLSELYSFVEYHPDVELVNYDKVCKFDKNFNLICNQENYSVQQMIGLTWTYFVDREFHEKLKSGDKVLIKNPLSGEWKSVVVSEEHDFYGIYNAVCIDGESLHTGDLTYVNEKDLLQMVEKLKEINSRE